MQQKTHPSVGLCLSNCNIKSSGELVKTFLGTTPRKSDSVVLGWGKADAASLMNHSQTTSLSNSSFNGFLWKGFEKTL